MNVSKLSAAMRQVAFNRRGWLSVEELRAIMVIARDMCKVNATLAECGCALPKDNAKRTWRVAWSQYRYERRNPIPSLT